MKNALVSIIIPSYNSLLYLSDSIGSAINQSYENVEIILIDDGSTDGTRDKFPEFEKLGLKCFYQKNSGASVARNLGLEHASGEYIQFLDADDILGIEKVQKQVEAMVMKGALVSFTPWKRFYTELDNVEVFPFIHLDYSTIRSGVKLMKSFGMENWYIPTSAWLTSKSLIAKAGYWNPMRSPNDDGEFFSRVLFYADKVICVDEILAYYRKTDHNSLSKFTSKDRVVNCIKSWMLVHALLDTLVDKSILCYPKKGLYNTFIFSYKHFPIEAKIGAKEFNRIDALFYRSNIKMDKFMLRIFGLEKTILIKGFALEAVRIFYPNYKSRT